MRVNFDARTGDRIRIDGDGPTAGTYLVVDTYPSVVSIRDLKTGEQFAIEYHRLRSLGAEYV